MNGMHWMAWMGEDGRNTKEHLAQIIYFMAQRPKLGEGK